MTNSEKKQEILACIDDKNIKYLQSGQLSKYIFPMARNEAHKKDISHIIIRFFIMAFSPENEILYLVQKRGKTKRSYPEYFTDSASGHVIYKKKLTFNDITEEAKRELKEEFGIPPEDIQNIYFYDLNIERDNLTQEIAYVFFGLVDYKVKLKPNPNELEVDGSRFYTKTELESLLERENAIDYSKKIWQKLLMLNIKDLFLCKQKSEINQEVALFLGRFQPLHCGHLAVIEYILESCTKLKIGIGSSQLSYQKNDPFTSEERKQFIMATLESEGISEEKYELFEIPDIFNAKKWVNHVVKIVGNFNVIFSNSDWVRDLFQSKEYCVADKYTFGMDKYNATITRNLININDESWKTLVPKEVAKLIQDFNGIERIKALYANKENT